MLFVGNGRAGYSESRVETGQVKAAILGHREFKSYEARVTVVLDDWCKAHKSVLKGLETGANPRDLIRISGGGSTGAFR